MFKRIGLKNITLVTISFIIVTILIVMGGYFAFHLQKEKIIENRYNELAAIKDLKVNQILNWRSERIGDAQSIINSPMISKGLKSLSKNGDEEVKKIITNWIHLVKQSYKYDQIVILDKHQNLLTATEEIDKEELAHLKAYNFSESDSIVTISDLHKDHKDRVHLTLSLIFKDDDGIYSILIIQMDPHLFLFPLIQNWPGPSKSAETLLIKIEGDSVLFLNDLRHKSNTALNYRIAIENSELPAVQAISGKTGLFRGTDYRGEKVLSDIGEVPETDWFIVAKIDESEIFGELQRSLFSSIIIVILLLAISYLVILRIWRNSKMESIQVELDLQKDKLRLSNLYATLSQINQAIVREQSKPELILTLSRLPVEFGNFKASAICLLEENTGKLKIESFAGELDYFSSILSDTSEFNYEDPSAFAVKEGKTKIYNNIAEDKGTWQAVAAKTGIKSCAASPIKPFDTTVGSFILYSEEEDFFQLSEIRLIEEIASDISFSLEAIVKNERRKAIEKQIEENERRLATLFTNLPGIAYRCQYDSDWVMEFMSEGTLNVTGYLPEEIVEQKVITYDQIIYPEDLDFVTNRIESAIKSKESFTMIYRIVTKQNTIRWVWERGLPIFDSKGVVLFLEGLITDITETKEAQDQLRKSEEYFRYLFQSNPLPMWIYDLESFNFLDANIAAINIYNYTLEEFQRMSVYDLHPKEVLDKLAENLETPRTEDSETSEWKHQLKNGEIIDVLIISHKIEFDKRPAVLVVGIDITDRKKAARTLIEAKEQAEAGEKLKSDFLAQMSHEIRTPVNVILSFSAIIRDAVYTKIDRDLREGFGSIENAGKRLIRTIDSILNMAQITRGVFELQPEMLDIYRSILLPLKHEFDQIAAAKNLEFIIENNCENTAVQCDRYSFSQIFANLIDNAIKYTNEGFVKISLNCNETNVSISVVDSGIGIAEEFLPRLFNPFSQEETGYSRGYEGTGLGLALVKNYCEMNNAQISVESKKGEGTTFKVTLEKYSEVVDSK